MIACVDQTIEGVHYASDISPSRAGRKAVARTLSDLAASAAEPYAVLLSLCVPKSESEARIKRGITGLRQRARAFGAELVGGDLSAAGDVWHWSVTALGSQSTRHKALGRHGAKPGDVLIATGPLGGAQLGRHLSIEPRVAEGRWLHAIGARAMMDTSDGAALDLVRLARASDLSLRLDALPLHAHAKRAAKLSGRAPWEHALTDGEDHELFALIPAARWKSAGVKAQRLFPKLLVIGRAERGSGAVWIRTDGDTQETVDLRELGGWIHG